MPASYAHYCFGQAVVSQLPSRPRGVIQSHRELYDIGLHGPDIFFYHRPLLPNHVRRLGVSMHRLSGKQVFRQFLALWRQNGRDEAALAYLYGFLCHFSLDSTCHAYVEEMVGRGLSHSQQEMELDRALLVRGGLDPVGQDLVAHIRPTAANARAIAPLFPTLSQQEVQRALSGTVFYHHLLMAPGQPKRLLLKTAAFLTGQSRLIGDMVMSRSPSPQCRPAVERLLALYSQAIPLAAGLIGAFPALDDPRLLLNFKGRSQG